MNSISEYDNLPTISVQAAKNCSWQGWDEIVQYIRAQISFAARRFAIECYPGVFEDESSAASTIPIGVDEDRSVEICGIRFSGIASAHEALDRDEHGRAKYLGYVLQFGGWSIYRSGDTVRYDGMAEKLQQLRSISLCCPSMAAQPSVAFQAICSETRRRNWPKILGRG